MKKIYLKKTKFALATLMLLPFFSFAQIDLVQTTNNDITTEVFPCRNGTNDITLPNDFARLYNLTALGYDSFEVTKVSFALYRFEVGTASSFPVSVIVYASTGGTEDTNLTMVGQETINITSAMVGTIVEVPFTTPAVVTSTEMFIVISAPDGVATSTGFFPGVNSNGEIAPGYAKALDCGDISYIEISTFQSDAHLILFPTGNPTTLGAEDFDSTNKTILLYPNPAKEMLYFSEEISNVKITDISGRVVKQLSAKATSVNVAELSKGIYILSATTQEGKAFSKKIIKE